MFDYELDKTIDTGKPAAYTYFAGTPEFMNHQKMITKNDADDNRRTSRKSAVFKMSKHRTLDASPEHEVGIIRLSANQISHRKPIRWLRFFIGKKD